MKFFSFFKLFLGIVPAISFTTSCSLNYYQEKSFYSVKKLDAHMHIRTTSDAVSEQASSDVFQMIDVNVGINSAFLQLQETISLHQVATHPKQIQYVTAFRMENWELPQWSQQTIKQLSEAFAKGALGVKLWKNIGITEKDSLGNFIMIDNPRFDEVIQFVINQKKTVLGHLGEPRNCWLPIDQMTVNNDKEYFRNNPVFHMFLHPEYPTYEAQINARDQFLARHPTMRFVGAHLGSLEYDVDSLAKRLDRFPTMAVDMADRVCHLQYQSQINREKVRRFIIKYQDRLIYGSDLGMRDLNLFKATRLSAYAEEAKTRLHKRWIEDWNYFATDKKMKIDEVNGEFKGLKLPKSVINKIYYTNAVKWFGITE